MSVILTDNCLENIIGLSRTECNCFTVPVNESDSELYLDEVEGLNLVQIDSAADCTAGSLWDLMRKAREEAIKSYKTDLAAKLVTLYKPKRKNFNGVIGRDDRQSNESISNIAGVQILCAPVKNVVLVIKRLGLLFSQTGTVDISIYSNISTTPEVVYNGLNTEANQVKWNTVQPVTLPLYTTEKEYIIYYIVYTNPGFSPKSNHLRCCSVNLQFSCSSPQFNISQNDARYLWNQWANVSGVNGADIDTVKESDGFVDKGYGLLIDAEIKCNLKELSCNDTDYNNSEIALTMAYAVRYRAAQFLAEYILSSGNINRFTMLDRERIYGKRNDYSREYLSRLQFIAENMNWQDTGCLDCIERMKKSSLL